MTVKPFSAALFMLCALLTAGRVVAEIVYLKDGTVLKGVITEEAKKGITLKVGDREQKIAHSDIKRVLYGNREMEEVFILALDGKITRGFMVDQDENAVIVRDRRDSPVERTISKKDIREISRDAIYPVDLEFYIKPAGFLPLDSGGADLGMTGLYTIGMGFNSMLAPNLRFMLEAGFLHSNSASNTGQSLRIIPVTLSLAYSFVMDRFSLVPRLGGGIGIAEFDTGEGDVMKSNLLEATAGLGLVYHLSRRGISVGIWAEYAIFFDGAGYLQGAAIGLSCGYRL